MRPKIGVTSAMAFISREEFVGKEVARHVDLIESLGGDPIVLARGDKTAQALARYRLDGVLFSGGGDVAANLYGGNPALCGDRLDAARDAGELALFREAFAQRVPTLCICRGMQLANVAFGGTLIEDIKSELGACYSIPHHQVREQNKPSSEPTHNVRLQRGSGLATILGVEWLQVNSMHHQAIRMLAAPLRAIGHTDDGTIEAVELIVPDFFFFGVQWHPESLRGDRHSIQLYSAFLEATKNARIPDSRMRKC